MTVITPYLDDDHLREECAVFGIYGTTDAAAHTALGLHALQHRGQEATGIVACNGEQFHAHRGLGHVGENFAGDNAGAVDKLIGYAAIGHNRYSTTGVPNLRNVQPLFADFEFGGLALCHNGNLTNALELRTQMVHEGSLFQSTTDSETIIHLIARSRQATVIDRVVDALRQIEGAYSVVCLTKNMVVGVRDPLGVRPLVLGQIGEAYILASETCALDIIGANFVRDIEPGEVVIIDDEGIQSLSPFAAVQSRFCIFEYVYFSRPDSIVDGVNVYDARRRIGIELAREHPVPGADMVTPVPDSGTPGAIGFAAEAGVPFDIGIIRNHYVGRTFIEPTQNIRHLGVRLKHNANKRIIKGKKIILVDDSIVRGTTSKKIVEMLKSAGAKEIHLRISSPPTTHSCFYGVDTPDRDKLIAANHNIAEMCKQIGATSLAFISLDGLYNAISQEKRNNKNSQYCDACFSGEYPIEITS